MISRIQNRRTALQSRHQSLAPKPLNDGSGEPSYVRITDRWLIKTLIPFTAIALPALGFAQRGQQHKSSDAPFLKPAEAVEKMDIPEGFEVSIFAAEPDIGEPIAFTFDNRGRVWVVENYNYVNRRNHKEDEVLSRIQIFEDTDSDGVFDTKKLFTDQIKFSSGIAVGFGGVYLGSPPELLFIPDADGDDVPDGKPEVLLDGWGIQDRHETLNSFIWGPDGWLYGCQGVFTQSFVGKPGAKKEDRTFIDAGIWRFHPVKKEFEIFARGLSNPWGFDFNDVGHGFATCCVIPHLFHVVQGGIYHKQSKAHVNPYVYDDIKTIRDHTHLSAHGGARFYLADTFPEKYRDQLFMCNIHEHAVLTDIMVPKGSTYIGTHGEDFMPTNDLAWVGFSVEIGPDGGVYILDWHDTDICGNTINFPDSGRIYRIMPTGAKKIERPNIGELSDFDLVAMQTHANDWYVRQARVELHARASAGKINEKAVFSALDQEFAEATTSSKRLRALWASHVVGRYSGAGEKDLLALLNHEDAHVRAWSVQLLTEDRKPGEAALSKFLDLATNDDSPTVRLYLASALRRLPIEQRWPILGALVQHDEDIDDNNIPRVLWFALEPAVAKFPEKALQVAMNGKIPFLQESVARRMVSGSLTESKGRGPNSPEILANWKRIINEFAPGFEPYNVGEGGVKKLQEFRNEQGFQTHPKDKETPCLLKRTVKIPVNKKTTLKVRASYHPHGDWQLRILANKEVLHDQIVKYQNVKNEWLDLEVDLSKFAGKTIDLVLENRANNWAWEFAYWNSIRIESEPLAPSKKSKPDILFIAIDDLNDYISPLDNHPGISTPNFERLAKRSVNFTNAHCAAPACHPSRVAVMTGVHPVKSGIYRNLFGAHGPRWRDESPDLKKAVVLSQHFRDHGYYAAGGGKIFHTLQWTPGDSQNDPDVWDAYRGDPLDPISKDWPRPASTKVPQNKGFVGKRPLGFHLFGAAAIEEPEDSYGDHLVVDWAAEQLNADRGDQPLFLAVGLFRPHIPWEVGQEWFDLYPENEVALPEHQVDDMSDARSHGRESWHKWVTDNKQWPHLMRGYLASISYVDHQLGRLLDALDASGRADNTVVVLWSDHGFHIGEKQNWEKFGLWEQTTRVPCFIHSPGKSIDGKTTHEPITLTDLYPTLCELADLPVPRQCTGNSVVSQLKNPGAKEDRLSLTSYYWPQDEVASHGISDTRYRYIRYGDGFEELYDLENDPNEFKNLAGDPEFADTIKKLAKGLPENTAPNRGVATDSPFHRGRPGGKGKGKSKSKQKAATK